MRRAQPRPRLRPRYPSDLTDAQWALVAAAMPPATDGRTGRPRKHALREVWNAIFYVTRTGCSWRALPHYLPPWPIVSTTTGAGAGTARSSGSTPRSSRRCAWRRGERPRQASSSSTASR